LFQIGLVIYLLLCFFLMYICFFADEDSFLSKSIMSDLPKRLIEEINEISPNAANFVKSWGNYITNEPNPIMQCKLVIGWTGRVKIQQHITHHYT